MLAEKGLPVAWEGPFSFMRRAARPHSPQGYRKGEGQEQEQEQGFRIRLYCRRLGGMGRFSIPGGWKSAPSLPVAGNTDGFGTPAPAPAPVPPPSDSPGENEAGPPSA